ncbi:unnamed protein product [Peronospora effusa]|nr:unnamed protein product [Peronospora effusa]
MVKLFLVIVGVKGSAFPVDIDTTESVGGLKDAIKAKKANALKNVGVRNLQLFLSKATDGERLLSGLKIVKKLKKGEKTAYNEALTAEENELQAENFLVDILDENTLSSRGYIYVLIKPSLTDHLCCFAHKERATFHSLCVNNETKNNEE